MASHEDGNPGSLLEFALQGEGEDRIEEKKIGVAVALRGSDDAAGVNESAADVVSGSSQIGRKERARDVGRLMTVLQFTLE